MTVEVERRNREDRDTGDVSGLVVNALLALVQGETGDAGVAQALALAGEGRPFSALGDRSTWSPLDRAVALFNAAALVTGEGAVARHLGEELLFVADPSGFVDRLAALGSPAVALKHIGPVLEHFETASKAEAMETAADHALIKVSPVTSPTRHAHLCEMTRGLLSTLPELYGLEPAQITEFECSARGGRHCLYAVSWQDLSAEDDDDAYAEADVVADIEADIEMDIEADIEMEEAEADDDDRADDDVSAEASDDAAAGSPDDEGPSWADAELDDSLERDGEGPGAPKPTAPGSGTALVSDRATADGPASDGPASDGPASDGPASDGWAEELSAADRSVAELRAELNRMGVLIEGTFATALELLGDDVESLLSQIAARADAVVTAHRYLLMVRVRPGTPIQLHHRGLEPDEAQRLAAELWREHPDDDNGTRLIVDIASPRRRYGRLAEFLRPGEAHPTSENKVLSLYAEYAATALDIFGVLLDAKRSDATARTLLSFSEALARVNNVADLVKVLADTVPEVTECAESTVHLWDQEQGRLVPRAQTSGDGMARPFMGPIVPVAGPDHAPAGTPSAPGGTARLDGWSRADTNGHLSAPILATKPPAGEADEDPEPATEVADEPPLSVRTDTPQIERLLTKREVIVLDDSVDDPLIRDLLQRSGHSASVVTPLFANGEFLGVVSANFGRDTPTSAIHDPDLHERLAGLADQAATTLQNLELLEQVYNMAWHDSLTGLPNRRLFEDRVGQELVRSRRVGEPVCLFFVDLDHFKKVNDTMGHSAGDDLIRQVGQRLVDTVRSQDTVARVGGDEFAILLPGLADQLAIDQLAMRSLQAMSAPFIVFGEEVITSSSIGIAMAPDHGDTYDELLSHADEAMYRAKARGRNAFQMYSGSVVNTELGRQAIDERSLYADLVHALDHDEFFVMYQPYIDLRTAQVTGVEALIRWDHPTLGTLEPSSFISLAERSDIIVSLDTWVLEQACRQAREWLDKGVPPLRLSVNLASRDLSNPELFANIDRTLEETAIDPALLELEITERVVLDRSGPARENIERLRRLGVRFTIDDFGTGNSSLSRIGSFPVSTLKIDQSFVQVLGNDGDNNALVSAIISMADRLGLACVAEGVETSTQSRVLLQRGCTTAQGYFFSPPLLPEDVEAMMERIASGDDRGDLPLLDLGVDFSLLSVGSTEGSTDERSDRSPGESTDEDGSDGPAALAGGC
jgi:diguanylate cyclase (GGDEF)-like protein